MAKRYTVDVFDSDGDHLATVTVYGDTDEEIDAKLAELPAELGKLDELIDSDQAFAELDDCDDSEMPEADDWESDDEDDGDTCMVEAT
jgi:hypothetical protein